MKVRLIGYRRMDFTAKDGGQIKGVNLYMSYPDVSGGTKGHVCDKVFIKNEDIIAIRLDEFITKDINVEFGVKGTVIAVSAV